MSDEPNDAQPSTDEYYRLRIEKNALTLLRSERASDGEELATINDMIADVDLRIGRNRCFPSQSGRHSGYCDGLCSRGRGGEHWVAFELRKIAHDAKFPVKCLPKCDSFGHEERCHWANDHDTECLREFWLAAWIMAQGADAEGVDAYEEELDRLHGIIASAAAEIASARSRL